MATDTTSLFQSSLTAKQMEEIWTGAVRFNAPQTMSEAEKSQACENIGAARHGSLLKILGHYDTIDALNVDAPREVGAAYSVGTATPYNLYIYDALRDEWRDYGQIRAADISARYIDNQSVSADAWEQDDTVFTDYHFKAQIAFPIATADDLPIVAFAPKEALSGNFAPIAYAFEGYVEVWAREQPADDIIIPVTTVIINGGNGVGLTNASGGISAGGIGTDKLADGAVTASKIADGAVTAYFTAKIPVETWIGDAAPFVNVISVPGLKASDRPKVDMLSSDSYDIAEAEGEAYAQIYRMDAGENSLTVYASEKPTIDLNIQLEAVRK